VLREFLRQAPLKKISQRWSPASTQINELAAKALQKYQQSIHAIFGPNKQLASTMGIEAFEDVRRFLQADSPLLPSAYNTLREKYSPDFGIVQAQRLLAWRSDLPFATRQEVLSEFRRAIEADETQSAVSSKSRSTHSKSSYRALTFLKDIKNVTVNDCKQADSYGVKQGRPTTVFR